MRLKMKLMEFRRLLVSGELSATYPQMASLLSMMLNFLLGFTLSAVPVSGNGGPFGVAYTAAAGSSLGGLMAAGGAALAYLSLLGFRQGTRYAAAVLLTYTAAFAFRELKISKSKWFMPCIAAALTLLTGMLGSLTVRNGGSVILPVAFHAALAFWGSYFFREALDTGERSTETAELRHSVALISLFACILMALSGAMILGMLSIGRVLALCALMIVSYKCGAVTGGAAGLLLGAAMDLAVPDAPFYAIAYGITGLISGVLSRHGRALYVLCFLVSSAVSVVSVSFNGYRAEMIYESALAGLGFLFLPNGFLNLAGAAVRPTQYDGGETGLRKYAARRIGRMGEAFRDLYDTVDVALADKGGEEDLSRIFDRASELVCVRCKNKNLCWNSHYMDTLSAFNDATPAIRTRGLLLKSDLPEHFTDGCLSPDELVSAVNGELRGQMYRRRFRARLAENRLAAYSQYFDVSEILNGVSNELQNAYGPDFLTQRRLYRFLNGIDVEADVSAFRDRGGRLHIVLESTRLRRLLQEPGYLDRISAAVGVRLCHPRGLDTDAEGRITLLEAEPYSVSVGIASMKKKGESVSGDRGTYFKTDQGVLCILLSDGMGSGESAARESVAAVRILERFLRSGVEPSVAMKILNSMMLLRDDREFGFATVDLMCIDLFNGDARFYKYGASPSYVRSGRTVKRVRCESLAAGLSAGVGAAPDVIRMRMKPGNIALIASDGVISDSSDAWIRELLLREDGTDTKALARETLQSALKQYGCSDDMTVLAVRIENRS